MKILGLDPGLRLTGYAVVDFPTLGRSHRLIDAGVIRLDAKKPIPSRLVELEAELESILEEHHPDAVAIEQLYAHYAHPRTAILMGHARGVLMLAAQRRQMPIHEFAANRVKQAVAGHGHADKHQIQRAVQSLFNLPELPEPPDVADAIAIAVCCWQQLLIKRSL